MELLSFADLTAAEEDAIVAATAVELDTELLTNDIRLAGTPRVRVRALRVT